MSCCARCDLLATNRGLVRSAAHGRPDHFADQPPITRTTLLDGGALGGSACPTRTTWNAGLRKLAIEHAGTRWSALRLGDDVEEIRDAHREHTREVRRSRSVDEVVSRMTGQLLDRLPDEPRD